MARVFVGMEDRLVCSEGCPRSEAAVVKPVSKPIRRDRAYGAYRCPMCGELQYVRGRFRIWIF